MTEAVSTSNDADTAAQRAAEQARLRKEKREAKIRAGGSARLNKISGMDDRVIGETTFVPPPPAEPVQTTSTSQAAATSPAHADPEEVDISQHYYEPQATARGQPPMAGNAMSEAQLRQMMLGMDRPGQSPFPNPAAAGAAGMNMPPGPEEDPFTKMMTQMMSGQGFPGQGFPGMAGGGNGSSPFAAMPGAGQQAAEPDPYTSLWRVIHAVVAIGLGIYIALLTAFTGTKYEREREAIAYDPAADANKRHKDTFFWVFATAETLLLTTRFYLDKRRGTPPGIVATVLGYLPPPYRGYVETLMRYGQILTTVRSDILGCMFVLGICAWWRS